jgi:hypothetical protein
MQCDADEPIGTCGPLIIHSWAYNIDIGTEMIRIGSLRTSQSATAADRIGWEGGGEFNVNAYN